MPLTTPERGPNAPTITPKTPEKAPMKTPTPEIDPQAPQEDPDFFRPKKEPAIEPAKDYIAYQWNPDAVDNSSMPEQELGWPGNEWEPFANLAAGFI